MELPILIYIYIYIYIYIPKTIPQFMNSIVTFSFLLFFFTTCLTKIEENKLMNYLPQRMEEINAHTLITSYWYYGFPTHFVALPPYRPSFLVNPLNCVLCPCRADNWDVFCWSTNASISMFMCPPENVTSKVVHDSLAALCLFCLFYLDVLRDRSK